MASRVITGTNGADTNLTDNDRGSAADLWGGLGNDTYIVDFNYFNPDRVHENANAGTDSVLLQYGGARPSITENIEYTLTDNVENLTTQFQSGGIFSVNQYRQPGEEIELEMFGGINAQINGNALNNVIITGNGDDVFYGYGGKDTFIGGNGNDTYNVDSADDVIVEKTNMVEFAIYNSFDGSTQATALLDIGGQYDQVNSTAANYTLSANIETMFLYGGENINGTGNAGNNNMYGNNANNTLSGLAGNDVMYGKGGNDKLFGGDGNDWLDGDGGDNTLEGGNGNDVLYGDEWQSKDLMLGGAGNDVFYGNGDNGLDTMVGGAGNDKFYGDTTDIISEAAGGGTDSVIIDSGSSVETYTLSANIENLEVQTGSIQNITGNASNNHIIGNYQNNIIMGLAGDDLLDGGSGRDTLIGGDGNDSYIVDHSLDVVTETNATTATGGVDTVYSSTHSYTLSANLENLTLVSVMGNAYYGTGNALSNRIIGNDNNNGLFGGAGHDTIDGGDGQDVMHGGTGNDTYYVDENTDRVVELAEAVASNGTQDQIILTSDYVNNSNNTYFIAANVEHLDASATNGVWVTGNSSNNHIKGGKGSDFLDGRGGNDTLAGGKGDDSYVVDSASDVLTEAVGAGIDSVYINQVDTFTLGVNVENAYMLAGAHTVNGNALDNIITGNSTNNSITGGAGNDYLAGGYGRDTLQGGEGNDTLHGGAGIDGLQGGNGNDTYIVSTGDIIAGETAGVDAIQTDLGTYDLTNSANGAGVSAIENLSYTGTGSFDGTGNALANKITGAGLVDTLSGGDGNDTLDGGAGADDMAGGAGNDTYYVDNQLDLTDESASAGQDSVISSVTYTLQADLENLTLIDGSMGPGHIDATGNELNNKLVGNDGSNVLDGRAGLDSMSGGKGDDLYYVDVAGDVVTETDTFANGGGDDTVYTNINYTLTANVEELYAITAGAKILTGNAIDNLISGNVGADTISGLDGNDELYGNAGNDTLLGGIGDDYLEGDTGNDSLDGGAGNDYLRGSSGIDTLVGGAGDDTLSGGSGNDIISGGAGNDTYMVFAVGDVVTELLGGGTDKAEYYSDGTHTLSDNVENADVYGGVVINLTGNDLANTISTHLEVGLTDTINGGAGLDTLNTNIGNIVGGLDPVIAESVSSSIVSIEQVNLITNGDSLGDINTWNMGGAFNGTTAAHNQMSITGGQLGGSGLVLSGFGKNVDFTLQDNNTFGGIINLSGVAGGWLAADHLAVTVDNFFGNLQADDLGHLDLTSTGDDSYVDVSAIDTLATNIQITGDNALALYSIDAGSTIDVTNFSGDFLGVSLIGTVATDTLNVVVNNVNTALSNYGSVDSFAINSTGNNTLSDLGGVTTTVAGTGALTLNNVSGTINASAFTGELIVNASNAINITGGIGDDWITGSSGADTINGGAGSDVLTGGFGADIFVFSDAPATGVDLITDFDNINDNIHLSLADFGGLGIAGNLLVDGTNFFSAANVGDTALAATAFVLYDSATGALYYDNDASTTGDAVQFAQIGINNPAGLSAADFTLIA